MRENGDDKMPKWNTRIVEDMVKRAIKRHHIRTVQGEEGSRNLYVFDGRIYQQTPQVIGRIIATEECYMFREAQTQMCSFTGNPLNYISASATAIHKLLTNDEKKGLQGEALQRIVNGENFPLLSDSNDWKQYINTAVALAPTVSHIGVGTEGLICLSDCVISYTNGKIETHKHSPNYFFTTFLDISYNYKYDFSTEQTKIKEMLLQWGAGDIGIARLLAQVMGGSILQGSATGKIFALENPDTKEENSAGNGKSTFLELVKAMLGEGNTTGVSLQAMAKDTHQVASLIGKFANIVDDMPGHYVGDISVLKTCVTGGNILINPKHVKPYFARITATNIIACNKFPRIGEKGQQIRDRVLRIPFMARFRDTDKEIKEDIMKQWLNKPATRRAALEIALWGLSDKIKNNWHIPNSVKVFTDDYIDDNELENDSVLAFLQATEIENLEDDDNEQFAYKYWHEKPINSVYDRYISWCIGNQYKGTVKKIPFSRDFYKHRPQYDNVTRHRISIGGKREQVFHLKEIYLLDALCPFN